MTIEIERKTRVIEGIDPHNIPLQDLMEAGEPVILKGLADSWKLVQLGRQSHDAAMHYIQSFDSSRPLVTYEGDPDIYGRFFYNDDMTGLNFRSGRTPVAEFFDKIRAAEKTAAAPAHYIGSTTLDLYFPGLSTENNFASTEFESHKPLVSIWMGNRTVASAHYDLSNNLACCAVGRRRFTLFPPEQVANLYPGPLEPTPGGQVVTMVDFRNPDLERFPRFKEALEAGQVADLEPGDGLFYPSMWWHHVEAFDDFNVLINYWWNQSPKFMDTPQNTLLHGLLSLRDRPEHEKKAWRALFDYYIFGDAANAGEHLPEHARGNLGPIDEVKARRLRAELLNRLNR